NYAVTFRVYNDGMAYRFATAHKDKITILDEEVKYRFKDNLSFYFPENENYESTFALKDFYSIDKPKKIYLPLVMQPKESTKLYRVLLSEADVIDYPSLLLKKSDDWLTHLDGTFKKYPTQFKQGGFLDYTPIATAEADYIALTSGTRTFPWRAIAIVPNDKALLDQDLIYKLAQEPKSKSWDWVKPGLCTWEYWSNINIEGVDFKLGQNTKTYEYYINFASAQKIPYVVFDWKWSLEHDLRVLNPEMDMPYLLKLAKEKDVKVVLWVLAHTLYKGLDNNVDYLKKLGASGVKIDFFDRDDQLSNQMYEKIADACAKRQLIVDFHGCAKPSGLHKAYPNILNYEAVYGNEYNVFGAGIPIDHHLKVPFIRGAIGPMDYTPGGFRNSIQGDFSVSTSEPKVQGTRAHQMAMFIVYEAGLQMMCDSPTEYLKSMDLLKLLAKTPETWDETVTLDGKIGEYVLVARRAGTTWYIGAMTNWASREMNVDLSFLGDGSFKATIVSDGINAEKIAKDYKITVESLSKSTAFKLNLAKGGGAYIKLEKQ
ncbi:MAG TPA: glycoside hydrolase family 97 catalytic domain-containing protein, partial [Cytophagaceae bacterium]